MKITKYKLASLLAFCGSFLLFVVQPLAAKKILPIFGGAQSVWTASMLFFQILLFIGYATALLIINIKSLKLQKKVFIAISIVTFLITSFITIDELPILDKINPVFHVLLYLFFYIGLPYLVLSMLSPLLQSWCEKTGVKNPYILYRASNAGSFAALFFYPFLIEPKITLNAQHWWWQSAVILLLILINIWVAIAVINRKDFVAEQIKTSTSPLNIKRISFWILLAFLPSSALLGATNHLTTNIVPFPLIWILPLAVYLLSFIIAFSKFGNFISSRLYAIVAIPVLIAIIGRVDQPIWLCIILHCLMLLVLSVLCHSKLYELRPNPEKLGYFYLFLSLGGMCGGLFNSLLAPILFKEYSEYPLIICLTLITIGFFQEKLSKILIVGLIGALITILLIYLDLSDTFWIIPFIPASLLAFSFRKQSAVCGAVLVGMWCTSFIKPYDKEPIIKAYRNFYGIFHVAISKDATKRKLIHGITTHGEELIAANNICAPRAYYHPEGPAGDIFELRRYQEKRTMNIGLVGLGIGSLFCYAENNENWTAIELNPLVIQSAKEDFKILSLSDPKSMKLIDNDGRKELEQEPLDNYDILIIDAFSSDAIPLHLLSIEAIKMFLSKINKQGEEGILAYHISNRFCDLKPVIAKIAKTLNIQALFKDDLLITQDQSENGHGASQWAILTASDNIADKFQAKKWQKLETNDSKVWTDDFSNIYEVLRW